MGFAAHRAYSAGIASTSLETQLLARQGCTIYTIQLGFNLLWTPLFFVAKRSIEATVLVAALTCVVGYLVYIWGQVDAIAGWALVPYVGWLVCLQNAFQNIEDWVLTLLGVCDISNCWRRISE